MQALIDVFRMVELEGKIRARVIIKLGRAINDQLGGNYTEPLVYELVRILDCENEILFNKDYIRLAGFRSSETDSEQS